MSGTCLGHVVFRAFFICMIPAGSTWP